MSQNIDEEQMNSRFLKVSCSTNGCAKALSGNKRAKNEKKENVQNILIVELLDNFDLKLLQH